MEELLKFVELTQSFKGIRRKIILAKEGREENDAEHSYQLALVAWYLIRTKELSLNIDLAIRYALVHDLVEIYAGDTPAGMHKGFEKERETKHERELQAIRELQNNFPEFLEMHELIAAYETRRDEESRFVYALDKVLPILNIYLDKGHSWKLHGISLQDLISNKSDKVNVSPDVKKYFDEIIDIMRTEQATLFPNTQAELSAL